MPNERDLDVNMTPETPDAVMTQASKDLKHGMKDTSKGPEMDATYAKQKRCRRAIRSGEKNQCAQDTGAPALWSAKPTVFEATR